MGISGVNFAIAETGSILLLENEGNIRMTTSLPSIHLAVMGIEKVIPRLSDLALFLRLLPRSGTGQHLTTYQSILSGARREGDGEGPEEVHILLLDNGRTAMLREPVTRQSLACIRCGACLNACPVYQQIGGHAYGSVYPGPIGAIITPQLSGLAKAKDLPYASSLCGACKDVCPVKIDIPELLLNLRGRVASGEGLPAFPEERVRRPWIERLSFKLWAWACGGPRRFRLVTRLLRMVSGRRPGPLVRKLLPPVGAWMSGRELRPVARRPFRDLWKDLENKE